jgi:adenylate kinase
MYVVLLGAPGAGKGTQAPKLARAIQGEHLSTGDMFREAVRQQSDLGRIANEYMRQGALVPDEIVLGMVMERLGAADATHSFVLDGFPRTLVQAKALDEALEAAGRRLDRVIYIEVPTKVLFQRLGGRWTCSNCQAIFHESSNPPSVAGVCDRCGGELRQRRDDRPDAVEHRLQVFETETAPLIKYYSANGLLRRVDGNLPANRVTELLLGALNEEAADATI